MSKTWFITGAGRGFGREFASAALGRGDRVAATARNTEALKDLVDTYGDAIVPLPLEVTDRAAVSAAVATAHERLGRLDVVVNNAGYGLFGTVEEITEQQLRDQLEVNLFGVFHVTQAVLPILREQGSGHIVQISTVGGIAAFPTLGGYHASKWALEGLSESLAQEVTQFGVSVTLIEPGGFSTDWAGSSAVHAEPQPQYAALRGAFIEQQKNLPAEFTGDPTAVGPALLKVVDAEQPPLRVLFGLMPTQVVPGLYQGRLDTWKAWEPVSLEANGHASS
ncbi:NADP-dependent 3-hydroxy acid dehydrogenase YdfG [Nocardia amikacinitolerans]|uniref:SDR family NAD(P)-dependent oxidoreductase n=1 Tax=Nocardia amikacinitolerans TaxID=756689 RepID=UPI00082CF5B9|nr:SDR family NAD(P)-dependent oxidoreductase [Nocardia amikacinitolerans]MCP2317680.1 NADP-dependent 3-hydroxy acid dehydrogenase YdfG [Nocardia amikacinitolerans]